MQPSLKQIPLDRLLDHSLNAHTVTVRERAKIANNIRRTGRYRPLIVRELTDQSEHYPGEPGYYQILDGHQRRQIFLDLVEEGRDEFSMVHVDDWSPIADEEALILLATLNTWGDNIPARRGELLHAISKFTSLSDAAQIVPESERQIQDALKLLQRPVADIQRLIEKAEQPDTITMSFVIGGSQKAAHARFIAAAQLFAIYYGAEFMSAEVREGNEHKRISVLTFQIRNAAKAIVEEALKRAGSDLPPGSRNKRGQSLEQMASIYLSSLIEQEDQVPIARVEADRRKEPSQKKRAAKAVS